MSRSTSATFRSAVYAPETDEVFLVLMEIDESSLAEPIRMVHNHANVTSRGNVYAASFFEVELPSQRADNIEPVRVTVGNVDQAITVAIREAIGKPTFRIEVVLASDPDTVEAGPFDFVLESAEYDALTVTGELVYDEATALRYPADMVTPWNFQDAF